MEHILQFAVNIDDAHIQKLVEESAAKQITNDIKTFSHGTSYYGGDFNREPVKLKEIFQEEVSKCVKDHADEIISEAIKEVAKRMMASKKVKEAIDSVVGEDK